MDVEMIKLQIYTYTKIKNSTSEFIRSYLPSIIPKTNREFVLTLYVFSSKIFLHIELLEFTYVLNKCI